MKNINYKDYVWLSNADKETFISIYNKDEDFKAISFIANNNEYELKKNDLKLFSQNLTTTFSSIGDRLSKLPTNNIVTPQPHEHFCFFIFLNPDTSFSRTALIFNNSV